MSLFFILLKFQAVNAYVKDEQTEPVIVNLLRSPGIDFQPGGIDPRNKFLGSITI